MNGYLTVARIPGDPATLMEAYERTADVMDGVGRDHGLILHGAGRGEDGLVIVNLWPDVEASERAAQDPRRNRSIAQPGIDPTRITREHHALDRCELFG